jgi:hypothetical protein
MTAPKRRSPRPPAPRIRAPRLLEQLTELAAQRRMADIRHAGRLVRIEPYGLRKSRWGLRLHCFVYDPAPEEVIEADYLQGWHLYALDDISEIHPTAEQFTPRPSGRYEGEEVSITLRVRPDGKLEGEIKR